MARFKSNAALGAVSEGGREVSELNRTLRDTEADVKEAGRKLDGDESIGDKLAGAGDRLENAVKNAGDEIHEGADDMSRDASYEQGRMDERNR